MIERKFDITTTQAFRRQWIAAQLDEYEENIVHASLLQFCASLDKSPFRPVTSAASTTLYEVEVPVMFRTFVVLFEVDGIDAYALHFEEIT